MIQTHLDRPHRKSNSVLLWSAVPCHRFSVSTLVATQEKRRRGGALQKSGDRSPHSKIRHYRKSKILASTALLVIFGFVVMVASIWRDSSAKSYTTPAHYTTAKPTLSSQPLLLSANQIQVERITITPVGFDPEKIMRPRGQVVWAIDNRSGLDEVWLRVERIGGERVIDVRVNRRQLDWRKKLDLSPGRYRLTEVNHPDWLCIITITE